MAEETQVTLPIKEGLVLDILDQQHPALSSTNDMPIIETKPDSTPEKVEKAAPDPVKEEGKTTVDTATAATEGKPGADDEHKPPRGVQKRLDELTKQREDAERRAEAERAEKLRLLAMLESRSEKPKEVVKDDAPVRPNRGDFANQEDWDEALMAYADDKATWVAKREIKAQIEKQEKDNHEFAIAEGQRLAREAYVGRVEKTKEKYADFKEVAESPDVVVSIPMAHAIVNSQHGAELQYYLGKNPDEADRISKLDVESQLVELRVIEVTKLVQPVVTDKPKVSISAAPRPITQSKAAETVVVKDPSTMAMDEYAAWRKSQKTGTGLYR